MIPPRETIKDNTRRLTIDLKLRSGASLHLAWSKEASDKAKSEPALNDELLKASKELPKPVLLMGTDTTDIARDEDPEKGKGKQKEKSKGDFEKKLKGFLGLSKK